MSSSRIYTLNSEGRLYDEVGEYITLPSVQDTKINVPHLMPFVLPITLPGNEVIKILASFSSHCWTEKFDSKKHVGQMIILDYTRERAFDAYRYQLSSTLPGLIQGLTNHKCYLTPEKRNYMAFDGRIHLPSGEDYRIFFRMEQRKGRWEKVRYKLEMTIESAYPTSDPALGTEVSFANIVSKTLRGEKIRYAP